MKTIRFKDPTYVGDPRNAVKIFNEREVDELVLLDIQASRLGRPIQYELIREIASEAFMPVGYGGGIQNVDEAQKVISLGFEKVILSTQAVLKPELVTEISDRVGASSMVVCLDVKKNFWGRYATHVAGGQKSTGQDPIRLAVEMERRGAGELIINNIDRDGTMQGYDLELLNEISSRVTIPVIACGGASRLEDLHSAIEVGGASAAAAGSLFVFQGRHRAVLISYPTQVELKALFQTENHSESIS